MPLRDHFRSPVNDTHSWDELHGGWPMEIVRHLQSILPAGSVVLGGGKTQSFSSAIAAISSQPNSPTRATATSKASTSAKMVDLEADESSRLGVIDIAPEEVARDSRPLLGADQADYRMTVGVAAVQTCTGPRLRLITWTA